MPGRRLACCVWHRGLGGGELRANKLAMSSPGLESRRRARARGGARARPADHRPEQLRTYECDGLTNRRVVPALVALPQSAAEVAAVVRTCHAHGIPFVARGAGTGLSGGALPVAEGSSSRSRA